MAISHHDGRGLLQGGDSLQDLSGRVFLKRPQPAASFRLPGDFLGRTPPQDHVLDHFVVDQDLKDSRPPLVARVQALAASSAALETGILDAVEAHRDERLFRGWYLSLQ